MDQAAWAVLCKDNKLQGVAGHLRRGGSIRGVAGELAIMASLRLLVLGGAIPAGTIEVVLSGRLLESTSMLCEASKVTAPSCSKSPDLMISRYTQADDALLWQPFWVMGHGTMQRHHSFSQQKLL